ncbi:MAG: anaerobic ribonucleoside-triphosphate reductase activating protein [Treponema sp.]|nr:anaerobic ribonucleoside-triphosphate reductase activating protein [Treponema sp.]
MGVLVKTSLVDFPSHVSAVLFLHGCNLRCPYCYNKDLVCGKPNNPDYISFSQIIEHLEKRRNVLTGFVISGGEALLCSCLPDLIKAARNLGYKIKLDTNGTLPEKLIDILNNSQTIPDFIALDIKTSPEKYGMLLPNITEAGAKIIAQKITKSIKIISQLPSQMYEFRTVLVPPLIDKNDIEKIALLLPKNASWQFAPFKNENCIDENYNSILPYTDAQMTELVNLAKTKIPNANLR